MKNFLTIVLVLALTSCAGLTPAKTGPSFAAAKVNPESGQKPESPVSAPPEIPVSESSDAETPDHKTPDPEIPYHKTPEPEKKSSDLPNSAEHIMGAGIVPGEKLAAFLLRINNRVDADFVRQLSTYYVEEAAFEGVNHDTAFAQMCLETGFLRYGGLVTPDMNNFCGLGAIGPGEIGHFFPDARAGVRAHIQHLQAYASTEPLNQELIDPRYHYVKRGSSPTIYGLSGTWAADRSYDIKISRILKNLYDFSF